MNFRTLITKKRLTLAAGGVAMAGGLASLGLVPGMANVSSTVPSSLVAPAALTSANTGKGAGKGWLTWLMRGQEVTVARTSHAGKTVTFTLDKGLVKGVTSSSITIDGPAGSSITGSISANTKFGKLSLQEIETDFSGGIKLRARLIERNGVLTRLMVFQPRQTGNSPGASNPSAISGSNSNSGVSA